MRIRKFFQVCLTWRTRDQLIIPAQTLERKSYPPSFPCPTLQRCTLGFDLYKVYIYIYVYWYTCRVRNALVIFRAESAKQKLNVFGLHSTLSSYCSFYLFIYFLYLPLTNEPKEVDIKREIKTNSVQL